MHITSVELHNKLGAMIDKALVEPIVVTKHNRDHVVIVSAERFAAMESAMRRVRLTGSLTVEELALIATAEVPNEADQKLTLAKFTSADELDL